jgi:hypothetical protein
MVLKAQIGGYDVGRVFMDAGSGINQIYARTLKAMCISLESPKPTECSFHGIVSRGANFPLEKIELDVCFGNNNNYRREKLEFEVIDWPSQYHAILGRPAFAKFMAVHHYAYLTLKIPGPKGTIAVQGSFEVSNTCDKEFRDFYFHALGSLVVLSFPQPLNFSSVLPKPLSETLTRSSDGRNPV